MIVALTSLPPPVEHSDYVDQARIVASWRAAGLTVKSFNGPAELEGMRPPPAVELVRVLETTSCVFGRPFVPISSLLRWAQRADCWVLVINADIELAITAEELVGCLRPGALTYFVRHNYERDKGEALREPCGIDAFLLHGRDAALFEGSCLSMGKPMWDYWIPWTFVRAGRQVYAVEEALSFHRNHKIRWSARDFSLCVREFGRMAGIGKGGSPLDLGCSTSALAEAIHAEILGARRLLWVRHQPPSLRLAAAG